MRLFFHMVYPCLFREKQLLHVVLFVITRRDIDLSGIIGGLFEIPHAPPQGATYFRQLPSAENDEHQYQNDDQLRRAETEHVSRTPIVFEYGKKKGRSPAPFNSGSLDRADGAGIGTGAAFGAGVRIDHAGIALLADGTDGTGLVTGAAIDAFFSNGVGHESPPDYFGFPRLDFALYTITCHALSTPMVPENTKNLAFPHLFL